MSDDILHTGRADIHHPKGPLTAEPAAQQPLSRGERLRRNHAAQRLGRILASLPEEVYLQLDAGFLEQACAEAAAEVYERAIRARDARVRAAVAEEIAAQLELLQIAQEDLMQRRSAGGYPEQARHCATRARAYKAAAGVAREHAAAPSVRPDTDRTPDVGTPDPQRYWWQHDDCDSGPVAGAADWPGRPCSGCGMSLGGWTRGAPIAEEAP